MTQIDTSDTKVGGNTKLPPSTNKRSRKWCFTINNYTEDEVKAIKSAFQKSDTEFIIGYEVGEQGTPHIQGFVNFKNARSFKSIKKTLPRAHIEKARGSVKENWDYCSKDGKFDSNIDLRSFHQKMKDICLKEYEDIKWKDWQENLLWVISDPPDSRSIRWFWDTTGGIGKSFLCKYIALTRDVIIADGKKNDIFNQVNMALQNNIQPKIIILDVPRSSIGYVNYSIIEKLKDGLIYSGKYEGGVCCFPHPHVIVFANTPPETNQLSRDRWIIKCLDEIDDEEADKREILRDVGDSAP